MRLVTRLKNGLSPIEYQFGACTVASEHERINLHAATLHAARDTLMDAKLSIAMLCLLATMKAYTAPELTFSRSGPNDNRIVLGCQVDTFPAPSPTFYTIIPGSSSRLRVDSTTVQGFLRQPVRAAPGSYEVVFTLTPETEAKFTCESQGDESSGVLLAGGSVHNSYIVWGEMLKHG